MAIALLAEPLNISFASPEKFQQGGILRLGTYHKLLPLNPFEVTDTFSAPLLELVFNRLVRYEAKNFQPDLAEGWKISEDGRTYIFSLREGVRFHDGTECTAEDVLHSLQLAADPVSSPIFAESFKRVQEWKILSKYRLEIRLKEPFSPFLLALWRIFIVPKHKLAHFSKDLPDFLKHPVGTGPFVFSQQDESGLWLKANPDYFEGPPFVKGVEVKTYKDKEQEWSAFLREEIDLLFYLDWTNYLEINRHPDFHVFRSLSLGGYALIFNLRQPLLREPKVREAIAHAVNRRELIDVLENGQGVLMDGPFHPQSWAYDPETPSPAYDPGLAKKLLLKAGFKEKKGGMEKNGRKLVLNILIDPKNEQLVRMGKLIRQQLQEAGIGVQFNFFNSYEEYKEKVYVKNDMHAYLFVLTTGPEPDTVSRYWYTNEKINVSGYSRPEVDALFQKARQTPLIEDRAKAYHQIHGRIAADKPAIFLYYPYALHAASRHCLNVEKMLGAFILFDRLKDVRKDENASS